MKPVFRILIVAALCLAALIGMVVRESLARDGGAEVLLPVEAVDPRSLLSGHYVVVQPTDMIEDIHCPPNLPTDLGWWSSPPGTQPQEWLSIAPAPGGAYHRVVAQHASREEALAAAPLAVRGVASCYANPTVPDPPRATIRAYVGVDRFYVNQAEAQRIEGILRDQTLGEGRVFVILSLGQDGRARMKGLVVDGQRLMLAWL